jgi:hypothetical protein
MNTSLLARRLGRSPRGLPSEADEADLMEQLARQAVSSKRSNIYLARAAY